ncbi:four helix bundle protein [Gemmatimonadota bacterium]
MVPFERFEAWQLCHKLVLNIYRATKTFPASERFELAKQARRAAFSAAVNIAEGSAKHGKREFRRYLDISLGSLSELAYILIMARDLEYLSHEQYVELDKLRDHSGKVTWGLYRSMGSRK